MVDEISTKATVALAGLAVPYEAKQHKRANSLQEAAQLRGIKPSQIVKTMVVRRGKGDYIFVLVPGDREISWSKLRTVLDVNRVSMPDADKAFEVTGYVRGTITPFGAKSALPVFADGRISGRVSMGGGEHGVDINLDAQDLLTALAATSADLTDPINLS